MGKRKIYTYKTIRKITFHSLIWCKCEMKNNPRNRKVENTNGFYNSVEVGNPALVKIGCIRQCVFLCREFRSAGLSTCIFCTTIYILAFNQNAAGRRTTFSQDFLCSRLSLKCCQMARNEYYIFSLSFCAGSSAQPYILAFNHQQAEGQLLAKILFAPVCHLIVARWPKMNITFFLQFHA